MLRKKATSMPGKRKLKQHSHRWVEFRKANLVSNYSLDVAFHKTTPKYKMSAISTVISILCTQEIIKLLCTFQVSLKNNNLFLLYILYHNDVFVRKLLCPSTLS
jgi:hypothetical protein